jgi:hypothetical protein
MFWEQGIQQTSCISALPILRDGASERKKEQLTMRAAIFRGAFAIQVEQIPDAALLEPNDAVVQITHACICGTDLWPYQSE